MDKQLHRHDVRQVVSGGQTGVDRAALDAAVLLGLEHGGWCPQGRLAEDGPIPGHYALQETESDEYPVRTERNVLDSDGTLILHRGQLTGGTELTHRLALKHGKPVCLVDLDHQKSASQAIRWLIDHRIRILNIAGPRESSSPGVSVVAYTFLISLLR